MYYIIDKNLKEVRALTENEASIVESNPVNNTVASTKRADFLSKLHSHKQWLKCACNGCAVIYVGHSTVPYTYIKSNSAYDEHELHCDFSPKGEGRHGPRLKPMMDEDKYNLQPKPVIRKEGATPNPGAVNVNKVVTRRYNRFYRLVRNMFLRAGLNVVINGEEGAYREQKARLLDAAAQIFLDPKIKVGELLFINYGSLDDIGEKIVRYQKSFTKNHPHGVCLWIASSYEKIDDSYDLDIGNDRTIRIGDLGTSVSNFHMFGGGNNGPYLFAGIYTYLPSSDEQGKNEFSLTQLLIIPLLSRNNWIFVDSNYERKIGSKLVSSASYWYATKGLSSNLEKPLEDIEINEHYVLPDFDITVDGFRQFVEVMGFNNPSYIARKDRQIPLMEQIAPVKKVNTFGLNEKDLDEKAFKFAKSLFVSCLKNKSNE